VARSSSASDKTKVPALVRAAETLLKRPDDPALLAQVAALLEDLGQKPLAARALEALAQLAREKNQFAAAAYAVNALAALGDARGAKTLGAELARAYAAGSTRAGARRPPPSPQKPRHDDAGEKSSRKGAAGNDAQAAFKLAGEAITAAQGKAKELSTAAAPLSPMPLCSTLDEAELGKLIAVMTPQRCHAGDVIVDIGEEAKSLFLVARGALTVSKDDQVLAHLQPGAFFGEIALLGGTRRTARVVCATDAWLLEIPRDEVEAAARKAPALADVLARHARTRLLANTMKTSEVFQKLDPEEREEVMDRFEAQVFSAGGKIVKAGEPGDRLHVIVSGDVEVRAQSDLMARLGPGDVFGEMSLLGRRPASADVIARSRTVTLNLDRTRFDDIAGKHPEILGEVYKLLVAREQENARPVVEVRPEDIVC
jgi:cAMP-dependent protein kinase regulator